MNEDVSKTIPAPSLNDEQTERATFISRTVQNMIQGGALQMNNVARQINPTPFLPTLARCIYAFAEALWEQEKRLWEGK